MKNFDFILEDDKEIKRTIIRFYPKETHIHSFDTSLPTCWEEVYKVYYSWGVLCQYYDDDGTIESTETLFRMTCDECSEFPNLSGAIKEVMNTGENMTLRAFGQPAADWEIRKREGLFFLGGKIFEVYDFEVFDNFKGNGFRFALDKNQTIGFCKWLDRINDYALKHGEPI